MEAESFVFTWKMIAIPVIAALIGWITNWIAIKMLFHPKKPIHLGLFTLHGIFHRRQKDLAKKLGDTIEAKLLSHDDIHKTLSSPQFVQAILPIVDGYIQEFIEKRLINIHPMLIMLPESMLALIKDKLMEEFESMLPQVLHGAESVLENQIKVKEIVRQKIEAFDVSELEDILFSILKSEFKTIEILGGVLGFFIGVAQVVMLEFF